MRNVSDSVKGIAGIAGFLLAMVGFIFVCCEAPSMRQQFINTCSGLIVLLIGVFLIWIGVEKEDVL